MEKVISRSTTFLLLLCLTACSLIAPASAPTQVLPTEPSITFTSVATSTSTPNPTQTSTPLPTFTQTPTETFTPTPPLLALPGTPLPSNPSPITLESASQVSGLASWREPTVTDLAWTPDGYVLAVSNLRDINLYNVQTRQILRTLYPTYEGIVDIEYSPTNSWFVSGSRQGDDDTGYISQLELWMGPDWKPMGLLYGSAQALSDMTFSPDGKIFTAAYASSKYSQNYIDFWNAIYWTTSVSDTLQIGTVLGIGISGDNSLLAATPDLYAITLWDIVEKEVLHTLYTSFTGAVNTIAFSPDGVTLASGHYDGVIRLWDIRTGELILTIETDEVIQSLAFSPDGTILASGGSFENHLVRLWSAGSGMLLRSLAGHDNGVDHVAFSPYGQYLASASYDGSIRLWGVRP